MQSSKPFSEIREIFEKMMSVEYESWTELSELDFEIDRVTLSRQRIVDKNAGGTGLLVPAWNFYGKLNEKSLAEDGGKFEKIGESFMTINAVDGSVIDIQKGY